ncbi:hypothetical protein AD949_12615 [Acetobacter orleanensis]|nr:hypothetical protein AD949_12615 [Acetobacter orleanensis]
MYSATRTIVTSNGLTYTVTNHNYTALGIPTSNTYDVKISDSSGNIILNQNNINRGLNILNIIQIAASGDVIAGSADSAVLINLASIGTYVSLPGATGNFVIGAGAATANTYYIGGTTAISGLANIITGSTINVIGGTATLSGNSGASLIDALSGSTINIEHGGTFNTGDALASILSGTTINFGDGGGTLIINGGGTLINIAGSSINNYDPSKDTIELKGTTTPVYQYNISGNGNARTIILYDKDGHALAEYSANLANGVELKNGNYYVSSTNNPLEISYSGSNTYIGACFLAGSMIRTTKGDIAVEDVRVGDDVIAFDWQNKTDSVRSVVWVGKAHVNVRQGLPDDEAGYPVRVLKNAIADGVPYKDMLITAEHCLFFNGAFVPARMLVNGVSIFYDKSITSYEYYHVETEQHSVITADGMLTESYLDTGNRMSFRQDGKVVTLRGAAKNWDKDSSAPLCVERAFVEPLFRSLEWRANSVAGSRKAEKGPELTRDPDLHLVLASGAIVRPIQKYSFMLPPGTQSVRIVSRASRPSDTIGPFVDDRRMMGVSIGDIRLLCARDQLMITSHLQEEKPAGWYAGDEDGCAWTNGNAELSLEGLLKPGVMGLLYLNVRATGPYLISADKDEGTIVQSA